MDERSLEWYLDGEPHNGIVIMSSMWTAGEDALDYFKKEYEKMRETLKPVKTFLYGNEIDGLKGKIEHIDTFTRKRWDS